MEPRRLKAIMDLSVMERFDQIADGLEALTVHVTKLYGDAKELERLKRPRGAEIIEAFMEEESAKVLILLDLVRTDSGRTDEWLRQLPRFYSHLARCLYARAYSGSPAHLGEVRHYVDLWRRSHYLDGPNNFDWVFRNELLSRREQAMYIDLIESDGELQWTTPFDDGCYISPRLPKLVGALGRLGITSRSGLDTVSRIWADVQVDDDMHWGDARALNQQVVDEVVRRDLHNSDASQEDVNSVVNDWIFPLGTLDLKEVKVDVHDLKVEQRRRGEAYLAEMMGYPY